METRRNKTKGVSQGKVEKGKFEHWVGSYILNTF